MPIGSEHVTDVISLGLAWTGRQSVKQRMETKINRNSKGNEIINIHKRGYSLDIQRSFHKRLNQVMTLKMQNVFLVKGRKAIIYIAKEF